MAYNRRIKFICKATGSFLLAKIFIWIYEISSSWEIGWHMISVFVGLIIYFFGMFIIWDYRK